MTIQLDHFIVPLRDKKASAKRLADWLLRAVPAVYVIRRPTTDQRCI